MDYDILYDVLEKDFGIVGDAKKWFESYLTNRKQRVSLQGGNLSDEGPLKYGVPQGSCLGPLLFVQASCFRLSLITSHWHTAMLMTQSCTYPLNQTMVDHRMLQ